MLYLSRKVGESIIINNNIEICVKEIRGKSVKLGFSFPPDATVLRKEIHDAISAENRAAAGSSGDSVMDMLDEVDLPSFGGDGSTGGGSGGSGDCG